MTVSRIARHLLLASAVLPLTLADMAFGQQEEPNPNVTVADRARPDFDPLGIRAGSFLIFPELAVTGSYTDNAAFDAEDENSDFVTSIAPSVEFISQWSRHELALELGSDIAIYVDENDENYEDFFALGRGRYDVSRQTDVAANVEVRQSHEGRDDPEDPGDDDLVDYYQYGGGLGVSHQLNRVTLSAQGDALRNQYENNDQEDRDATIYNVLLRSAYEYSPRLDLFVEGRYNLEDRDDNVDDNGIERDNNGYEGRLGAGLDISAVLFGEAFVGYRRQQFDEDDFDDEDGVSFGVDLNWNPTLLTSVGLSGLRDFRPTDQGDAASNFRTEIGLTVDHELLRNLIFGVEGRYQIDDFRGDDREDDTYLLGGGLTYWLNRNLSLNGGYNWQKRDSNEIGEDYEVNTVLIGLTARL